MPPTCLETPLEINVNFVRVKIENKDEKRKLECTTVASFFLSDVVSLDQSV